MGDRRLDEQDILKVPALLDALRREIVRAGNADYWRERAEKAEAELNSLVEGIREPTAEMCAAYYDLCRNEDTLAVGASNAWKAMSAVLLREVELPDRPVATSTKNSTQQSTPQ
jgi:hypothetical protein